MKVRKMTRQIYFVQIAGENDSREIISHYHKVNGLIIEKPDIGGGLIKIGSSANVAQRVYELACFKKTFAHKKKFVFLGASNGSYKDETGLRNSLKKYTASAGREYFNPEAEVLKVIDAIVNKGNSVRLTILEFRRIRLLDQLKSVETEIDNEKSMLRLNCHG